MVARQFLRKIKTGKYIIGTVTDCPKRSKAVGSKFIIRNDRSIIYSDSELSLDVENICIKNTPVLKNITTAEGLNIEIYLEKLEEKPRLLIFGAGHISLPLTEIAKLIGFEVIVMDDREEFVNKKRLPAVDHLVCTAFTDYLAELKVSENDYIIIVTRGQKLDYYVLKQVIRSKANYIGMIGSQRKVSLIFNELSTKDGIEQELLAKVFAPIGLAINSETPEEIAVSIAAELVRVRRQSDE